MAASSFPAAQRAHAELIWRAAVESVKPQRLMQDALAARDILAILETACRIVVVGAGKAGAAMAEGVEQAQAGLLRRTTGVVNVPAEVVRPLQAIRLHAARPAGHNHPTAEGVAGTEQILQLVAEAGPDDVVLCLLSGGGSALLPLPAESISLADKQGVTALLHACGATINDMNAVRKHLSRVKGGRLAQAFHGKALISLIISDVIGDPLDVIASGPTAPDPTTFADALAVLERHGLIGNVSAAVLAHLRAGAAGKVIETPKTLPANVCNRIVANNALALSAAMSKAEQLGYSVVSLGSSSEGETTLAAAKMAKLVTKMLRDKRSGPPVCVLSGGETTVTLPPHPGLGGRNQEFALAMALQLGPAALQEVVILCGGTDGEDGPTDAAGAFADAATLSSAGKLGLDPSACLARHDSYRFFEATADLFKSGLTETNVMDIRVALVW